jgi:outer membrane receptor for ferrienterochelin and colicin
MEYIPLYGTSINTSSKLNNGELYSCYFQDTWKIDSSLTVTGGLRINKYNTLSTPNYEPRLSFNYSLSNSITLKGAAGKYYQYLMQYDDFSNLLQARVSWITANNSDIKPLSADHYIIGALYEKNNLSIDFEVYYKKLYNVLESLHEWYISERFNSLPAMQNNASAKGIDFTVKKTWGNFLTWLSYSYCETTSRYYYENTLKQCPSSSDSPHKIDLTANYKLNMFIFSAVWHYMSGRPYTVPLLKETYPGSSVLHFEDPGEYNSRRFPGSHQLDISVIYTYSNSLFNANTGISIFNVYDRKNIWYRFLNLRNNKIVTTDVYMLGIIPTLFLQIRF